MSRRPCPRFTWRPRRSSRTGRRELPLSPSALMPACSSRGSWQAALSRRMLLAGLWCTSSYSTVWGSPGMRRSHKLSADLLSRIGRGRRRPHLVGRPDCTFPAYAGLQGNGRARAGSRTVTLPGSLSAHAGDEREVLLKLLGGNTSKPKEKCAAPFTEEFTIVGVLREMNDDDPKEQPGNVWRFRDDEIILQTDDAVAFYLRTTYGRRRDSDRSS